MKIVSKKMLTTTAVVSLIAYAFYSSFNVKVSVPKISKPEIKKTIVKYIESPEEIKLKKELLWEDAIPKLYPTSVLSFSVDSTGKRTIVITPVHCYGNYCWD
ncbi:MAG: hypothetical protein NTZ44_02955 [Candidatus Nomurabacteria bacterium]|nr:hypothetical protein [Candidatus Nomurabacteria bacterium]